MACESWDHAIRLLTPEEVDGGVCAMGNYGPGPGCDRPPVYLISWRAFAGRNKGKGHFQNPACIAHTGSFARKHDVDIPAPVHVVVRRREDVQQLRDVVARLARQQREMQRFQAEFAERLAGFFSLSSPSQRRLPLGMDASEHRQHLFGDVREGVGG